MAQHTPIKPEKLVATAAAALEQALIVPAAFRREGIDQFRGAKDDTVNIVVEGVLPYRTYGWRNDRSTELVFDEYAERKIAISFGGDIYNAVKLTDEQNEMDFGGWAKLAAKQTEALGRGLEYKATAAMVAAPYEVTVQLDEADLRGSLIKLRQVMNKLNVQGARKVFVEGDLETALLSDKDLQLAQNVGDAEAVSALREATLGRRYGFDFIVARELDGMSVAAVESAFVFMTAAPGVPQSVPFGATASHNGVALRWIRDYDSTRLQDRSIFNTYQGFRYVDDPLVYQDATTKQPKTSTANHFVRAVKVTLGDGYEQNIGSTELETITGLTDVTGA